MAQKGGLKTKEKTNKSEKQRNKRGEEIRKEVKWKGTKEGKRWMLS